MKISIYQKIHEGAVIPFWYGVSYRLWYEHAAICYPIPFNYIIKWAREIYFWFSDGPREKRLEEIFDAARRNNYNIGYQEGMRAAYQKMFPNYSQQSIDKILEKNAHFPEF